MAPRHPDPASTFAAGSLEDAVLAADPVTGVGPAPRRAQQLPQEATGLDPASAAKGAGVLGGGAGVLYLLDHLLREAGGGSVPQVLASAGPLLGVLYANAPQVVALAVLGLWLRSQYRREQRAHVRRDRKLLAMFGKLAAEQHETTRQVGGLRSDVQRLQADMDGRFHEVSQAAQEQIAALGAATSARLDEHGQQIERIQEQVSHHDKLLRKASPASSSASSPASSGGGGSGRRAKERA